MKTQDEKRRFVEMRAQGISYAKIALELKTSKQTLIAWSREFEEEIQNLQAIEREALIEEFQISRKARLSAYGREYQRIQEELAKRNLNEVSTEKLWDALNKISNSINREMTADSPQDSPCFRSTENEELEDMLSGLNKHIERWTA